jgi:molybdate transport system regulatory protein
MNSLEGTIDTIKVFQNLTHVRVRVQDHYFSTVVIDTPETASYLTVGHPVKVLFKETEVVIGRGDLSQISLQNRIEGEVKTVDKGGLLSKIMIQTQIGDIGSIITTNAVNQLEIIPGSIVTAMIKTNELMLST